MPCATGSGPNRSQPIMVTYIDLVSPGTIDEKILGALRSKIDIAGQVLGEDVQDWLR